MDLSVAHLSSHLTHRLRLLMLGDAANRFLAFLTQQGFPSSPHPDNLCPPGHAATVVERVSGIWKGSMTLRSNNRSGGTRRDPNSCRSPEARSWQKAQVLGSSEGCGGKERKKLFPTSPGERTKWWASNKAGCREMVEPHAGRYLYLPLCGHFSAKLSNWTHSTFS